MVYFLVATEVEIKELLSKIKKIDNNLYQITPNHRIFITGMGKEKVSNSMPIFREKYAEDASQIYNIGISGSISQSLKKFSLHKIGKIKYKDKIHRLGTGYTLGSFDKAVWSEDQRKIAADQQVDLVDMEGFFIYEFIGQKSNFICIKVISDFCHKTSQKDFENDVNTASKIIENFILNTVNETNN